MIITRMAHVHFIGIGGSGLSAIARFLHQKGITVTGSDRSASALADELRAEGIPVEIGHRAEQILGADLVIRSSAVPDTNPEVTAAQTAGIPVLKRADFLPTLLNGYTVLAVAGTHGKTTTTAMLAHLLDALHQNPSYIIGGISHNLRGNAHAGSQYFVIEADEYDRMFLGMQPNLIILTYVEHDHPDCYPTLENYRQAFQTFVEQLLPAGTLIACTDNAEVINLIPHLRAGRRLITCGTNPTATYQANHLTTNDLGGFSFDLEIDHQVVQRVDLQVPGAHNVRNMLAALAAIDSLGFSTAAACAAAVNFQGTGRRFEVRGTANQVTIIDDYAHHPTEIRATLAAAKARYAGRRIWVVWQPHTFSRTLALWNDFTGAFGDADYLLVTDVYAARESDPGFQTVTLVNAIQHSAVSHMPTLTDAESYLLNHLRPGDVLLVLSAGNADTLSGNILATLTAQEKTNENIL